MKTDSGSGDSENECNFSDFNILYLAEGVRKEIIEFCCDINAVRARMVAMVRKALV